MIAAFGALVFLLWITGWAHQIPEALGDLIDKIFDRWK